MSHSRYYQYGAAPRQYTAAGRALSYASRAGETRSLGSLGVAEGALGNFGSLGKVQQSYFGGQELSDSYFGGQNKDIQVQATGAFLLSNNEKALVAVAVIGLAGWFFFGDKIKKGFKKNPPKKRKRRRRPKVKFTAAGLLPKKKGEAWWETEHRKAINKYLRMGYSLYEARRLANEDINWV